MLIWVNLTISTLCGSSSVWIFKLHFRDFCREYLMRILYEKFAALLDAMIQRLSDLLYLTAKKGFYEQSYKLRSMLRFNWKFEIYSNFVLPRGKKIGKFRKTFSMLRDFFEFWPNILNPHSTRACYFANLVVFWSFRNVRLFVGISTCQFVSVSFSTCQYLSVCVSTCQNVSACVRMCKHLSVSVS